MFIFLFVSRSQKRVKLNDPRVFEKYELPFARQNETRMIVSES